MSACRRRIKDLATKSRRSNASRGSTSKRRRGWRVPKFWPNASTRRRWLRILRSTPITLQVIGVLLLTVNSWFAINWTYQVVRKPSELFFPVSGTLYKTPSETWQSYEPIFRQHSTATITPELLAALAQVEGSGNPIVRTYWRWSLTHRPFEVYRPASSAVGMYQITDGTLAETSRYCIHDHVVVEDGPWHDFHSCWFNALYMRVIPSHAVEMTSAYLDRRIAAILGKHRIHSATLQQQQDLASVIHVCGAGAGNSYVRRGFRPRPGQHCGDHSVRGYIARVNAMKKTFARLAERSAVFVALASPVKPVDSCENPRPAQAADECAGQGGLRQSNERDLGIPRRRQLAATGAVGEPDRHHDRIFRWRRGSRRITDWPTSVITPRRPGAVTLLALLLIRRPQPQPQYIVLFSHPLKHSPLMLSTANVSIQFGAKPLFEQVSVKFADGNRYGLIGANGCGKSTFMKILGRELEPSAGEVMLQTGLRLGKLRQDQFAYEDQRVLDVVMQGHAEMWSAMVERDRIYADPNASDEDYMRAAELEARYAEYGGYNAEARAASILSDAGIDPALHDGPMREVAPGWKLRVLLAQALFSRPDVLLLDEPTNNLDIHSIRWLESVLNDYDATMVIISHDRHFLNQVCTHMADLDYGQIKIYPGNYDDFMLASTQARERVEAANAKAKDRISDLQEFVRRFSANASKARQATSRLKQIDKIKIEEIKPSSRQNPYIRFEQEKKLYRNAVTVEELSFTYPGADAQVLNDVTFNVEAGERIAVIGANGAGKTTLLRCLAGELQPTRGAVTWVENAKLGYMPQDPQAEFAKKVDLFTWMSEWRARSDDDQIVRATLGRLLFSGEETRKSVKVLSGGEKGRMIYGKLMLTRPNVLLLDEPTNHMDMETIESLQIGVEKYPGTMIFVSHDREFVGGIANRIIEVRPGGSIVDFKGTYDEYLKAQGIAV